ncbi:Rsp5p-dependent ubiquitination, sorting of cargo proteins at the multivesicular body [Terramyces sp. JEL0728]|nr:Rsp5p-dependent ubiquitination, sorting of cargo proteins at the multivesicular body [Terramyces sp. JEL0728]
MKGLFYRDYIHDSKYSVQNQLQTADDVVLGPISVVGYQNSKFTLLNILKFAFYDYVVDYDTHYFYNNCTSVYSSTQTITFIDLPFKDFLAIDGDLDASFTYKHEGRLSISGLTGTFDGSVFGKSDLGLFTGKFMFNNISLDIQADNSTSIFANEFTNLTYNVPFSVNSATLHIANLIPMIANLSGSVNFTGVSQYFSNNCLLNSTNPILLLPSNLTVIFFVIFAIIIIFLNILICRIKTFDQDIESLRPRNYTHPDTVADNFLTTYMVDLESTARAVKQYTRVPASMEKSQFKHTMLMPRIFPDFPFQKEPIVEISEMYRVGRQIVSFNTVQECSIQCSSILKPRVFKDKAPQPPPSFELTSDSLSAYFEVALVKRNASARIGFGFATCPYPSFRLPGHDSLSIAYHSSLGRVYVNSREGGRACGFPMKEGDTAGIGYRIITPPQESVLSHLVFYFTYNGVRIGDEFSVYGFNPYKLYPTIGAEGVCTVEVYFGDLNTMFLE